MTKNELATLMSSRTKMQSKSDALNSIEAFMEEVTSALSQGESVYLRGFGTFQVVRREAKKARDITRNTEIVVPAHNTVKFVPCNTLKRKMNLPRTRRSSRVCLKS